jgi:hypothetical protein
MARAVGLQLTVSVFLAMCMNGNKFPYWMSHGIRVIGLLGPGSKGCDLTSIHTQIQCQSRDVH